MDDYGSLMQQQQHGGGANHSTTTVSPTTACVRVCQAHAQCFAERGGGISGGKRLSEECSALHNRFCCFAGTEVDVSS